jgi:hypothetical protein
MHAGFAGARAVRKANLECKGLQAAAVPCPRVHPVRIAFAIVDDTMQNIERIVGILQPRRIYLQSVLMTTDSELNQRIR